MTATAATDKYDEIATDYDRAYVGPRWDLYDAVTLATAEPYFPREGGEVLDAGAGSGKFALHLLRRGFRVTLLEPSKGMLDAARAKVEAAGLAEGARFVAGGIERIPAPDASFDFVFCEGDPLSYCIQTQRSAARELLRVLRPGGGFYVSVDNRWNATLAMLAMGHPEKAFDAAQAGRSWDPYGVPVHAFDPHELRALLEEAGAAEVRVSGKICLANFLPEPAFTRATEQDGGARLRALEVALARDPATAGLGGHLHAVGRKGAGA